MQTTINSKSFESVEEFNQFTSFITEMNTILGKKGYKLVDTLEIEGLKRDWKFYQEDPTPAETAVQDLLMIRDYEEMMFQKFIDSYDAYLEKNVLQNLHIS